MAKDLNLGFPFIPALAVFSAGFVTWLIFKRRFGMAVGWLMLLVYSTVRSNPFTTAENDYQGILYHFFSLVSGVLAVVWSWQALGVEKKTNLKLVWSTILLICGGYGVFLGLHLGEKAGEKAYLKFMGRQSTIYDRPQAADVVNSLVGADQYYYVGPFDFEDEVYVRAKLPTKYVVIIPGMDKSEAIQQELLGDLAKRPPKLIVFNTEQRVVGEEPGGFLKSYLEINYFNLEQEFGSPCVNYAAITKWYGNYDFERHFWFERKNKETWVKTLLDKKLIKEVDTTGLSGLCKDRIDHGFYDNIKPVE